MDPKHTETIVGPDGEPQYVFGVRAMLDLVLPNPKQWEAHDNVRVRKNFGVTETARAPNMNEEHTKNRKFLLKELQRLYSESYGSVSILTWLHEYASRSAFQNYSIVTSKLQRDDIEP